MNKTVTITPYKLSIKLSNLPNLLNNKIIKDKYLSDNFYFFPEIDYTKGSLFSNDILTRDILKSITKLQTFIRNNNLDYVDSQKNKDKIKNSIKNSISIMLPVIFHKEKIKHDNKNYILTKYYWDGEIKKINDTTPYKQGEYEINVKDMIFAEISGEKLTILENFRSICDYNKRMLRRDSTFQNLNQYASDLYDKISNNTNKIVKKADINIVDFKPETNKSEVTYKINVKGGKKMFIKNNKTIRNKSVKNIKSIKSVKNVKSVKNKNQTRKYKK